MRRSPLRRAAAGAARAYYDADFPAAEALAAAASRAPFAPSPLAASALALAAAASARAWHRFHARHGAGFFHERGYIAQAFPRLAAAAEGGSVLEIGCGSGSNIFSLLTLSPTMRVFACDVTPAALRAVRSHPRYAQERERIELFLGDAATGEVPHAPPGLVVADDAGGAGAGAGAGADAARLRAEELNALHASFMRVPAAVANGEMHAVLMTFVLSALDPRDHAAAVAAAARSLRPGGLLFVRDHAAGDAAMLRAAEASRLGERLFVRGDGTLASFFELEEMRSLLAAAGFVDIDLKLACVVNRNRKTGVELRRVFVTGCARKIL
jgi:methyltransferase-like protein 6